MSALDFLWEETALDKAVLAHSEEDVKTQLELLQNEKGSIDPDQTASALTLAIKHNRPTIVSLLLPYSPSLQYFIEDALNSGSKKILDLFLEQGWDINEQRERDGPPALG